LSTFSSAVQALNVVRGAQDVRFDLILLAFHLPFLTPSEAIARLRSLPQFATVPIAVALADELEKSTVNGATHFLMKPIEAEQLLRCCDRPQRPATVS
jgi:CheY-like chemotaxis protein